MWARPPLQMVGGGWVATGSKDTHKIDDDSKIWYFLAKKRLGIPSKDLVQLL